MSRSNWHGKLDGNAKVDYATTTVLYNRLGVYAPYLANLSRYSGVLLSFACKYYGQKAWICPIPRIC